MRIDPHPRRVKVTDMARSRITILAIAALMLVPAGAQARGGGAETVGPPPAPVPTVTPCADIVVANTGVTMHKLMAVPRMSFNIANCSALSENITLTATDTFQSYYYPAVPCYGSTTYDLGQAQIAASSKASYAINAFRGACGAFERHTVTLKVTDSASGAVLDTGYFSWADAPGV